MLNQYEENLQNEKIEKNRLSEDYENKIQKLTMVSDDWLTDWLTDWQTDRQTDWLTDWLTEWLNDWLTDWWMMAWPMD